jgi:hypothetical protein
MVGMVPNGFFHSVGLFTFETIPHLKNIKQLTPLSTLLVLAGEFLSVQSSHSTLLVASLSLSYSPTL